jgi:hypothetical protein
VNYAMRQVLLGHGQTTRHKDAAQDIARDLAGIASHTDQLKGDARLRLRNPTYDTLKLRLEGPHSAVEAALLLRLGAGCG